MTSPIDCETLYVCAFYLEQPLKNYTVIQCRNYKGQGNTNVLIYIKNANFRIVSQYVTLNVY